MRFAFTKQITTISSIVQATTASIIRNAIIVIAIICIIIATTIAISYIEVSAAAIIATNITVERTVLLLVDLIIETVCNLFFERVG